MRCRLFLPEFSSDMTTAATYNTFFLDIYVICRPGGPCWEKLCLRPRAVLKTEGTVPPTTDRPRPANDVFIFSFRRVLCKQVLCWFSNLVYACVWHLANKKSKLRSLTFLCFLGHYFHFTFFAVKKKPAGKDAKAEKLVAVRTGGPDGKVRTGGACAISQSDSRI